MAEAFVEQAAASEQKKIVSLTSRMASLARDLAPRGIRIGLYSPG